MKIKDILNRQKVATAKSRIDWAMTIRGIKQAELCQKTGIPKSSMSQYLSGEYEPKQERLELIAKTLNVDVNWLRGYDVPMGNPQNHFGYEENPRELELCDYYDTLSAEGQEEILQYVKNYANGKFKANSPGEQELSEGEQALLTLFRMIPEERKQLVLQMIKAAIDNLK